MDRRRLGRPPCGPSNLYTPRSSSDAACARTRSRRPCYTLPAIATCPSQIPRSSRLPSRCVCNWPAMAAPLDCSECGASPQGRPSVLAGAHGRPALARLVRAADCKCKGQSPTARCSQYLMMLPAMLKGSVSQTAPSALAIFCRSDNLVTPSVFKCDNNDGRPSFSSIAARAVGSSGHSSSIVDDACIGWTMFADGVLPSTMGNRSLTIRPTQTQPLSHRLHFSVQFGSGDAVRGSTILTSTHVVYLGDFYL